MLTSPCIHSLMFLARLALLLSIPFASPGLEFRSFQKILQSYSPFFYITHSQKLQLDCTTITFVSLNSFSLTTLHFKGALLHLHSAEHSAAGTESCIIHHPHLHMHIPQQKAGQTFCQHSKRLGHWMQCGATREPEEQHLAAECSARSSPLFPRSTSLLILLLPYRNRARLEDKAEQKVLMESPVLASSKHELCLLIGLISMNDVLVFRSAQISLPKA